MKPKERDVLNLIKQDKAYEDYFFKKASGRKWFSELKEQGYFSPKNNPSPQKTENGSYRIPEWNVLSYLEKVSKKTKDDEIIDSLSDIIIKVTKNGKDNNRTWWFFVKIISNFPNDKIDNEILNLIPLWLDSQFGNDLVASEIIDNLLGKFLNNYKNNYENKIFKIIIAVYAFFSFESFITFLFC